MTEPFILHQGDCLEVLRTFADNSIDSIVTDPPYGLSKEPDMAEVLRHWLAGDDYQHKGGGFMGKTWDSFVPGPAIWRECLRVLKPGGHLLAFFGTRTQDIGTLAIRLAGFEIRDSISWVYGSGFPKSLDVSKAIDKAAGAERQVLSEGKAVKRMIPGADQNATGSWIKDSGREYVPTVTAAATDEAAQWEGWGTALKPALEPITVARKPLAKGCTVAANVLAHGTGALNIDGCRVAPTGESRERIGEPSQDQRYTDAGATNFAAKPGVRGGDPAGRWPANLIHDGSDEVVALFPANAGAAAPVHRRNGDKFRNSYGTFQGNIDEAGSTFQGDNGSAARFFKQIEVTDAEWLENLSPALTAGSTLSLSKLADAIAQSDAAISALPEGTALSVLKAPSTSVTPSESKLIATAVIMAMSSIVGACLLGQQHERLSLSLKHVSVVVQRMPTGTMTITASLSSSAGCAESITFSITPKSLAVGEKACEQSPARFMYCAKASRKDRNEGMDDPGPQFKRGTTLRQVENTATDGNHHPTVKPTDLMAYLCRLVTPPGGVVLDPFMGSGSTGKAAMREGFRFIGCELSPEYLAIAEARIGHALQQAKEATTKAADEAAQLDIFK